MRMAIDALVMFPQCDTDKILITGNSGGGTMSFYAACFDERIKLSVPSCAFCSYEDSIMNSLKSLLPIDFFDFYNRQV